MDRAEDEQTQPQMNPLVAKYSDEKPYHQLELPTRHAYHSSKICYPIIFD